MMRQEYERILVACDKYRKGDQTDLRAIDVARRLRATLIVAYMIDVAEVAPPVISRVGLVAPAAVRDEQLAAKLLAEGRKAIQRFALLCERESIPHHKEIYEGMPDAAWGELARTTDMLLIVPVEKDFAGWWHWSGTSFWRIAKTANRPVLLPGPAGLAVERIYLFYSNRRASSTALPHIAALAKTLAVPVIVQFVRQPRRLYGSIKECQEYLSGKGVDVRVADQIGAHHVESVAEQAQEGLLIFDRAFSWGIGRKGGCRLVARLIRESRSSILLCP